MGFIRSTFNYFLYSVGVAVLVMIISHLFPDVHLFVEKFWVLYGFIAGITYIAYILAYLGIERGAETGIIAVMASIALKMFFSMAFVLIYSVKSTEKGVVLALNFFSLYLLFTFFEMYTLLRKLRHQNK